MSQTRVELLRQDTNFGDIDVDSINNQNYPTAGPLSNRNLIINGAMTVHQRSDNLTDTGFIADRWKFNKRFLDQWVGDVTWETDAPASFSRSIKINTTTAETSFETTEELSLETRIEAQDLQHLDWGTANAKSLTLSFWVKCNKTGTQSMHVRAHDADHGYSTPYSISAADTWEYKTIVIPGNTAGSITNDNGIGIWARWVVASGDTAITENAWDTSNNGPYAVSGAMAFGTTIGDYFQITGVQLEVGSKSTPFEHESYGQTLAKCQRYRYQMDLGSTNNAQHIIMTRFELSSGTAYASIGFPCEMRINPNFTFTGTTQSSTGYAGDPQLSNATKTSCDIRSSRGVNANATVFVRAVSAPGNDVLVLNWDAEL